MKVIAIIPARYASTRFPGKPLVQIAGKPMIQHVVERVRSVRSVAEVIVATDDERIAHAVRDFGGEACLTSPAHLTGTDRIVEVAQSRPCDWILNVQGDEPLIAPDALENLIWQTLADGTCPIATLIYRSIDADVWRNPNVVKAVLNARSHALYFSRSPLPYVRDTSFDFCWKHLGVYLYRRDFLLDYASWAPTPLEKAEKLEQLRVLEHGYSLLCVESHADSVGVDLPEDIALAEKNLTRLV
jgi:3-deoxy-manno-octulosonate cytidylyltransferase (CMP-KDO synthetase)